MRIPRQLGKNPTIESVRDFYAMMMVAGVKRVPQELVVADLAARPLPGADVSWSTMGQRGFKDKFGTYQLRPDLKNLRPATLFIWGDKVYFGPATLGEETAKLAPEFASPPPPLGAVPSTSTTA